MPLVNGRYVAEPITSIVRNTSTSKLKVIVKTRIPTLANPSPYIYEDREISIGQTAATRRMVQKVNTENFYEFTFPPTQIAYEGMGVDIQEIPRPLLKPLIDIRGKQNYKAVFEFLVAEQFDGLSESVEQQLVTLESFANSAEPVYFENFDTFLTNGYWYIVEFSVKTSRVNTNGEIVAAQCSIGLLEYQPIDVFFSKFPKLDYTQISNRNKGGGGGNGNSPPDGNSEGAATIAKGKVTGATQAEIDAATVTAYRFSRTTAPAHSEIYKDAWIKVKGKHQWVLYSKTSAFPYKILGGLDTTKLKPATQIKITPYMTLQKQRYDASIGVIDTKNAQIAALQP